MTLGTSIINLIDISLGSYVAMGSPKSGHYGHKGRPGKRGGSAPSGRGTTSKAPRNKMEVRNEALTFVKKLTTTSVPSNLKPLSNEAREYLAQTVTKKSYKVYRGMGIVKHKVQDYTHEEREELNQLKVGDKAPAFLAKQKVPYASYTKKVSVAQDYTEGRLSVVLESKVPASSVIVDLENLPGLLKGADQNIFDSYDFDYFKQDKEVLVLEPLVATIRSISGRVPL